MNEWSDEIIPNNLDRWPMDSKIKKSNAIRKVLQMSINQSVV